MLKFNDLDRILISYYSQVINTRAILIIVLNCGWDESDVKYNELLNLHFIVYEIV